MTNYNMHTPALERTVPNPVQCPACKRFGEVERFESVELVSFEAEATGWAIGGNVKIHYCGHNRCRNCGNIFEDIKRAIPFQYPRLNCPWCGESQYLKCRIKRLEKQVHSFTFQANLVCTHCRKKNSLQRTLKELWKVTSVKIGPTGITLEKKVQ